MTAFEPLEATTRINYERIDYETSEVLDAY